MVVIITGLFLLAAKRFTLTDAVDLFLLDREAQNLAAKSLTTYRVRLTRFVSWCNDQGITAIDDLTTTHVRQYIAGMVRTLKDVTAKNHTVDIKTFLRFCVDERLLTESPADRVKLPKVVERLPQVLTAAETQRLYKACETDRDKALFLVMLDTGARCEEVANMDRADADIDGGTITIREGKPRRDRTAYISPRTRKELLRYIKAESINGGALWRSSTDGARLRERGISQLLERIADRAEVKCTPHKIRKTFITTLLRNGVDLFTLMKLSGHRDIESLKPYVAIADVDAEQAHRQHSPVASLLS